MSVMMGVLLCVCFSVIRDAGASYGYFAVGDSVMLSNSEWKVKESLKRFNLRWDYRMPNMLGKEYDILDISKNGLIALPSQDGFYGKWWFPHQVVVNKVKRNEYGISNFRLASLYTGYSADYYFDECDDNSGCFANILKTNIVSMPYSSCNKCYGRGTKQRSTSLLHAGTNGDTGRFIRLGTDVTQIVECNKIQKHEGCDQRLDIGLAEKNRKNFGWRQVMKTFDAINECSNGGYISYKDIRDAFYR